MAGPTRIVGTSFRLPQKAVEDPRLFCRWSSRFAHNIAEQAQRLAKKQTEKMDQAYLIRESTYWSKIGEQMAILANHFEEGESA